MNTNDLVDARGCLCPQPLILMTKKMKTAGPDGFTILVDNETARENICRSATDRGWTVKENAETDGHFAIALRKK